MNSAGRGNPGDHFAVYLTGTPRSAPGTSTEPAPEAIVEHGTQDYGTQNSRSDVADLRPARPRPSSWRRLSLAAVAVGSLATGFSCVAGASSAFAAQRPAAVSAPAAASAGHQDRDVRAFFRAGYGYTDALDLAALWNSASTYRAKVAGGAKLRAGKALPFSPGKGVYQPFTADQDLHGFFLSGLGYDDGLELAAVWGSPSVHDSKVRAGSKLLAGGRLPKIPKHFSAQQDVNAFFATGHTHADAVKLARLWHDGSVRHAKVRAGGKLLAGQTLPIDS